MSGHAILDSCHNCGKSGVTLNVAEIVYDCDCGKIPHMHIFVACDDCIEKIWTVPAIFPPITKA